MKVYSKSSIETKVGMFHLVTTPKVLFKELELLCNNSHTQIKTMLLVENLKYNLLSISQFCDKRYRVCFEANACHVINSNTNQIIYIGKRHENVYVIYIDEIVLNNESCLIANDVNDS